MRRVRVASLVALTALPALMWPADGSANHLQISGTVSAQHIERRHTDVWDVTIHWTAGCGGAPSGGAWYRGNIYMVDADTGKRIYVGGVVDTSGDLFVEHDRHWSVRSIERPQHFTPELTINCYVHAPPHPGPTTTVTGDPAVIPPAVGGSGGGGGGGTGGDYGSGDPTAPLGARGCVKLLIGTSRSDRLTGGDDGDVIFGFGGADRLRGAAGHDCLMGAQGADRLEGGPGDDRLTGGRGGDVLIGGPGLNAYDAGPGRDRVDARNGRREIVDCGRGRDRARVDRRDRVRRCERVLRPS